jgi:hypothetical protein
MRWTNIIAVSTAIILSGCVTVTDPVSMAENRYMITLNAHGGFQSDGELLSRSVQRANQFCQAQGLRAEIASTQTGGVQMWTPQHNQVLFSCVGTQ